MGKKIVTHLRPDMDACTAIWLVKKYLPGFKTAELFFVPAGETLGGLPADSDKHVVHVDTGRGKFDHHHLKERTCAAERVFVYLKKQGFLSKNQAEIIERIIEVVTMIDNFEEIYFQNPTADYYDFMLHEIIDSYRYLEPDDNKVVEFASIALDAVYIQIKNKIKAEEDVKNGKEFKLGKYSALSLITRNNNAVAFAQKIGYVVVVRKDPKTGRIRIKARPDVAIDLKPVYEELVKLESAKEWYYHISGKMVLNGSDKNPMSKPTKITLAKVIDILQKNIF